MLSAQSLLWLALAATALAAPTSSPGAVSSQTAKPPAFLGAVTAEGYTSQKWIDALDKARSVVAGLTFDQKVSRSLCSCPAPKLT